MRKYIANSLLWVFLMSLGFTAKAVESQGEFSGFQLSTCTKNRSRCLILGAEKALGSNLKALYVLTNPSVQILISEKVTSLKERANSGYIDFELQRLVLMTEIKTGIFQETIIDLKDLKASSTVMK